MTSQPRYVLVGGGLAASRAAQALRENGFDGSIVLVGEEDTPPYQRPPLSKQVLIGAEPPESALTHPEQWYSEQSAELLVGRRAAVLGAVHQSRRGRRCSRGRPDQIAIGGVGRSGRGRRRSGGAVGSGPLTRGWADVPRLRPEGCRQRRLG